MNQTVSGFPRRAADQAEEELLRAFLNGEYPPGAVLPGERELATQLGITRPTLREVLRRLESDGWLQIHQGKQTTVRDIWREGNLGALGAIVNHLGVDITPHLVNCLLEIRANIAPVYARKAIDQDPGMVSHYIRQYQMLPEEAEAYAYFDWQMHRTLAIASNNPIYTMTLNSFRHVYEPLAAYYFMLPQGCETSRRFYMDLLDCAVAKDSTTAEHKMRAVLQASDRIWHLFVTGEE